MNRLSPIRYYINEPKLVFKSILITPDRYLTIAGLMFALYALNFYPNPIEFFSYRIENAIIFGLDGFLDLENLLSFKSFLGSNLEYLIMYFLVGFVAPFLSFILTRHDTNDFTKVLSNAVSTEKLIKHLAFEILYVVESVSSKTTKYGIEAALDKRKNSLRTIESLKAVLAKRLMISHRELSDDFFLFSATVFVNRQLTRAARIYKNKLYKEKTIQLEKLSYNRIQKNSKITEIYLRWLIKTDVDLTQIEFMFQTRSVSAITYYLISILDNSREDLHNPKVNNFRILFNMQKAHRTGVGSYRAMGVGIMLYLYGQRTDKDAEKLRDRVKSALGKRPTNLSSLEGWYLEAQLFGEYQRDYFKEKIKGQLKKYVEKHKKKGLIYIVISHYSRIIRTIMNEIIAVDDEYKNVRVVISVAKETEQTFASRLMFHNITEELELRDTTEELELRGASLPKRIWRSTPKALMSRFNEDKDSLIVLSSCDRIGKRKFERDNKTTSTVSKTRHFHDDIAHLIEPISLLDKFKKSKNQAIDVFVFAGSYKYDLDILIEQFDKSDPLAIELEKLLPKPRRAGLYQWESNEDKGIKVKIISIPLPCRSFNCVKSS